MISSIGRTKKIAPEPFRENLRYRLSDLAQWFHITGDEYNAISLYLMQPTSDGQRVMFIGREILVMGSVFLKACQVAESRRFARLKPKGADRE